MSLERWVDVHDAALGNGRDREYAVALADQEGCCCKVCGALGPTLTRAYTEWRCPEHPWTNGTILA